jgi:hypothetical protein
MKIFFIIIIISTLSDAAIGQKKYMIQQIAALQVYIGYLQKGYSIAKKGLNVIGDLKKGEFNLHSTYFNSLKSVNPKIRNSEKVAGCITLQVQLLQVFNSTYQQLKQSKQFSENELSYMHSVFTRLIEDCTVTIDELIEVTTSNKLEMKDDERLRRIDNLYNDLQTKNTFVQSFSSEAKVLAVSRLQDQDDVNTSRSINGIKN